MNERLLTAFLISFSAMFVAHYFGRLTWGAKEPRPNRIRMIVNYTVGVSGIGTAFLFLHPELWIDLSACVLGAGSATALAHGLDYLAEVLGRDKANELIEEAKK